MVKPYPEARFMSVAEVAALLGVSSKTIYRLIGAGDIPATNIHSNAKRPTYRIPRLKFEATIKKWEHEAPKAPAPATPTGPVE